MREIVFEVCAETLEACEAARDGGAQRVELCSALSEGGVTPSHALVREAVRVSGLPVHVIVRPRGGDYCYSAAELQVMAEDVAHCKELGAAGVVLGVLRSDDTVDVEATRKLAALARPMEVTFHRAIDDAVSLEEALEQVIAMGCDRVLTSGGRDDVLLGAEKIARLVAQARGRIAIAAGGGLRMENAAEVARVSGANHFHGSLRTRSSYPIHPSDEAAGMDGAPDHFAPVKFTPGNRTREVAGFDPPTAKAVRAMVESLRTA